MLKKLALFLFILSVFILVPSSKAQTNPARILFVGDSITELGSFRYHMYCRLRKDGFNVDFVGSNKTHGPPYGTCIVDGQTLPFQFDPDSEGHSGWTTGGLADKLRGWVQTQQPDFVLIHTGTNDVLGSPWTHMYDDPWGNKGVYTYLKKMLVDIKAVRPTAKILLALTVNVDPVAQNSSATVRTADLNAVIQRVYNEEKNNYNLYLVDQNTGFNSRPRTVKFSPGETVPTCSEADMTFDAQNKKIEDSTKHTYDCIHPNGRGGEVIAQKWYSSLAPLLAGQPVPTLPPGISPTITPTRVPTPTPTRIPTTKPTSISTGTTSPSAIPTQGQVQQLSMKGLKVQGNKVVNENGQQVKLVGVNISGTEYSCVGGKDTGVMPWGIFEVPATQETINGLKKWNINTVRVPLNESCWNGITSVDTRTNLPSDKNQYLGKFNSFSGENYRSAITNWVNLLTQNNIAVVVEIHWSAPGTFVARDQTSMLNRDNSIRAWTDISNRFKNNSSVMFDLHNEPYSEWKDWNQESTTATWNCWKKGSGTGVNCTGLDEWWDHASNSFNNKNGFKFQAAGMDEITAAVRATGAQNIIILGGLSYANNLTHFLQYKPNDPNIMASIHNYNFNHCDTRQCWEQQYKPVAQVIPVIAGEIGQSISVSWRSNLDQEFVNKITAFYDENNIHYLAWLWNKWGCNSHQLVSSYDGTVNKGCKHSEDLYKAMQKTLASHNPGVPVSPSPTSPVPTTQISTNPVPTTPATITQNPTTAPTNVVPTTPPECTSKTLGDADCDSRTSLVDFEYLRRGITSGNTNADFNKDGKVTIDDFTNWLTNFLF